ncbi:MAG: energy-coupling factor ABC transporter ATP-binding protein [Dethiobacteria bacterium]|jgi:energy-coupling factor transport system ATP-binding protein
MESMERLKVEHLWYTYEGGNQPVLKDITFKLLQGEALGIIGLNGSGKTTMSYCLCGIIPHYLKGTLEGRVLVNGKDTREIPLYQLTTEIGIVLQDPGIQLLMPTVEDDIAFALENHNLPREEIRERIYRTMETVGITGLKDENPNNLSGGEKQLVALATVLALNPSIIIFDESLSMLDELAAQRIIAVMQRLKDEGTTQVIIDHTMKGFEVYDKIFILEEGRIIYRGSKDFALRNKEFLREHRFFF